MRKLYRWLGLGALLCCGWTGAQTPLAVAVNIDRQPMESALNAFASQTGLQLLFHVEEIITPGLTAPRVVGMLAPEKALQQLLANSGLRYEFVNPRTVAIRPAKAEPTSDKSSSGARLDDMRLVQTGSVQPADPAKASQAEADEREASEVMVTGSRIRSLLGEATAQPVITFTREDLDRYGVQSVAELRRYIPQLAQTNWRNEPATSQSTSRNVRSRVSFGDGLRGLGGNTTLVLVNGRRLVKLGQVDGSDGYDLNGIPFSAIERVEVLTDGASAVYGADALAGVINIILKQDYVGTEFTNSYTDSFDTDTSEKRVQVSHGLRRGKLSISAAGSWFDTNSLSPRDRPYSASDDRRPFGGDDEREFNAYAGAGAVMSADGENLPGLSTDIVGIPAGSSGIGTTVAQYGAAPVPERFDARQYIESGDTHGWSLRLDGGYQFTERLRAFFEGGWGETRLENPGVPPSLELLIPAGYPGNPFGVDVLLSRTMWEAQHLRAVTNNTRTEALTAGLEARLPRDWRGELSYSRSRTRSIAGGVGGGSDFDAFRLQTAINDGAMPIVFNDGRTTSPLSDLQLLEYFTTGAMGEIPRLQTFNLSADGRLWSWAAGDIRLALGGERQIDDSRFPVILDSPFLGRFILDRNASRTSNAGFAELQVPLVGKHQSRPLLNALSVSLAARHDSYSDFGGKTVPRYGLLWQPAEGIAVRASYGEGFKVPLLTQLALPEGPVFLFFDGFFDPARGNTFNPGFLSGVAGGNPALTPEESRSLNFGAVFDLPLPGLSFSADYYDLEHTNRITSLTNQQLIDYFPERITRAPLSDDDVDLGYSGGEVTSIDVRPLNVSYTRIKGWDLQMRYEHDFGAAGELSTRVLYTYPLSSEQAVVTGAAVLDDLDARQRRSVGTVAWARGPLTLSATATHTSDFYEFVTVAGNAGATPATTLWDAQFGYDFARSKQEPSGWNRLFREMRLAFTLLNIADKDPAIDETGRVLGNVDPRGRRFQLSLNGRF